MNTAPEVILPCPCGCGESFANRDGAPGRPRKYASKVCGERVRRRRARERRDRRRRTHWLVQLQRGPFLSPGI